jgi:hypothetical protein
MTIAIFKTQIEKSCVIALHCSLGSGRQWAKLAQELGTRFQVLAPDIFRLWQQCRINQPAHDAR